MANVIIKDNDRREREAYVAKIFGVDNRKPEEREAAEVIAARTEEALKMQRR